MPRKRPEDWKPKREPAVTQCMTCGYCMYNNTHICPDCKTQTYAGFQAELRKNLKGK